MPHACCSLPRHRHLSGGLVETLPAGIFDSLTSVTFMRLERFYVLQELPANVFAQMTSLPKLSLIDFGVSTIHPDAFNGLGSLTELYVARRGLVVARHCQAS